MKFSYRVNCDTVQHDGGKRQQSVEDAVRDVRRIQATFFHGKEFFLQNRNSVTNKMSQ